MWYVPLALSGQDWDMLNQTLHFQPRYLTLVLMS
jgi:hypothetical protein